MTNEERLQCFGELPSSPPRNVIRRLSSRHRRMACLTDPAVATAWGYASSSSNYAVSQGIAARARRSGYNVIKYKSLQCPGLNYAVLDDFTTLLQPQGVFPVR